MDTSTKDLQTNLSFRVPYHPSVTEKDMHGAAELWVEYEQRAARRRQQQARAFADTLQQRHERLRSLLGAENTLLYTNSNRSCV